MKESVVTKLVKPPFIIFAVLFVAFPAYAQCGCDFGYTYRSYAPSYSYYTPSYSYEPSVVEYATPEILYEPEPTYSVRRYWAPRSYYGWGRWSSIWAQAKAKDKAKAKASASAPEGLKLSKVADKVADKVDKCNLREYFVQEKSVGRDKAQATMRKLCSD